MEWRERLNPDGLQMWMDDEPSSILHLIISDVEHGTKIYLVQTGVPTRALTSIRADWPGAYWKNWELSKLDRGVELK